MKMLVGLALALVLIAGVSLVGCSTGVEASPDPGIVRVMLSSNAADTSLTILGDTTRLSRVDHYYVTMTSARLYRGPYYADLYTTLSNERIPTATVNITAREWLDGRPVSQSDPFEVPAAQTRFTRHKIFEWYVPPGSYDRLEFAMTGVEVFVAIPRQFTNPLELPEGVSPVMSRSRTIIVNAGKVTEVELEVFPFKSLRRYKDAYLFDRKLEIVAVTNH